MPRINPLVTTGVALASTAAVIVATPTLVTAPTVKVQAVSPPALEQAKLRQMSVEGFKLLALSDITPEFLLDVYFDGAYGISGNNPSGPVGLAYYVGDQVLETLMDDVPALAGVAQFLHEDVTPYFYEQGLPGLVTHLADVAGVPEEILDFANNPVTETSMLIVAALGGDTSLLGAPVSAYLLGYKDQSGPVGLIHYIADQVIAAFAPATVEESGDGAGATVQMFSSKKTEVTTDLGSLPKLGAKLTALTTGKTAKGTAGLTGVKAAGVGVTPAGVDPPAGPPSVGPPSAPPSVDPPSAPPSTTKAKPRLNVVKKNPLELLGKTSPTGSSGGSQHPIRDFFKKFAPKPTGGVTAPAAGPDADPGAGAGAGKGGGEGGGEGGGDGGGDGGGE